MNVQELEKHANNVRKNILRAVYSAQSGHPGGSLSSAEKEKFKKLSKNIDILIFAKTEMS